MTLPSVGPRGPERYVREAMLEKWLDQALGTFGARWFKVDELLEMLWMEAIPPTIKGSWTVLHVGHDVSRRLSTRRDIEHDARAERWRMHGGTRPVLEPPPHSGAPLVAMQPALDDLELSTLPGLEPD